MDYMELKDMPSLDTPEAHAEIEAMMAGRWEEIISFRNKSADEINSWQFDRVKTIVDYAFGNIPLYRKKYSAAGFLPGDLKSWSDFEKLPVVTKDEIINGFPFEIALSRDDYTYTVRSSGTTGQFVTIGVTKESLFMDTILGIRQFKYQNKGAFEKNDCVLFIYGSPWRIPSINGNYRHEFISMNSHPSEVLAYIKKLRPKVIRAYPSYLERLAEVTDDLTAFGVTGIISCSEFSGLSRRQKLTEHLKTIVLDEYASEELTRISLECPERTYHLEEDACYTQIVDPVTFALLPDNQKGLVVGTNLLNMAVPLIRYSQGDIASMKGASHCACGSHFREMNPPDGRMLDSIITSRGEMIPGSNFIELAYNWLYYQQIPLHGLKYQIIQEPDLAIKLYLVPNNYAITKETADNAGKSLYELLPADMSVSVFITDTIPEMKNRKFRAIISKVDREKFSYRFKE